MTSGGHAPPEPPPAGRPARHLLLLRHAATEPAGNGPDELRTLTPAGRRQGSAVGAWLASSGLAPEQVLVSSAVRARQTWELVRGALGPVPAAEVHVRDELYTADAAQTVQLLRQVDDRVRTVLVVGHEPTMSAVAELLAASGAPAAPRVRTGLPTGGCAVLAPGSWSGLSAGTVPLLDVVRPER